MRAGSGQEGWDETGASEEGQQHCAPGRQLCAANS